MVRDNKLFQEALKRGSAHAWNEEWNKAAGQYQLALQEFPDDVSARTYLAMALYKSGEYQESLALYQSLWNGQPSNLTMLQRVAELQEAVGEREGAAISYGRLADAHTRRRSPRDAFKAWLKVVELTPGKPLLWSSLVEMAVQAGTVKEVIPGYLGLARDLALQSRFQEAIRIVERAVSLDATNPLAISLLTGIRRAMEYWWRATGLGEAVLPEDLERLIPRVQVQVAEQPRATAEPAATSPARREDVPSQRPAKEDRPAITVYASNVTLSMDRSGSISIQGEAAPTAAPQEPAGGLTWEEFEALTSQPLPAGETEAPPLREELAPLGEDELVDAVSPQEEVAQQEEAAVEGVTLEKEEMAEPASLEEEPAEGITVTALEAPVPIEASVEMDEMPVLLESEGEKPAPTALEESAGLEAGKLEAPEELEAAEPVQEEAVLADATIPSWHELMQQAEMARNSGELQEAADLHQQSLVVGTEVAQQFIGLGDAQEQLGQLDQAAHAYTRALELTPNLPQALVGLARIDLLNHKLDAAERGARRALQAPPGAADIEALAANLLLDILRERAAYGDLGGATEGLAWLQSSPVADRLPLSIAARIASTSRELLGRSVAEHLHEIAALPKQARGDAALALSKAEKQIDEGQLRSAADEMYRLVSSYPDFLPAQSVLGKVLVAQGRPGEASDRANRLLELYGLRERPEEGLEILLWMVRAGIGKPEHSDQLVKLLQAQNRGEEVEAIMREPSACQAAAAPAEAGRGAIPKDTAQENPAREDIPAGTGTTSEDGMAGDGLLLLSESKFASGDVKGAAGLIETALHDNRVADVATTAALLRVLQLVDPSTDRHRDALIDVLAKLGLPEDLADR